MLKKFKSYLPGLFNRKNHLFETVYVVASEEYYVSSMVPGDIKQAIQIEREVYNGEVPWTKSAFLSELYSLHTHQYLVVCYQEKIIGFIGLRITSKDGHITNIAILPAFQNKGIGSLLLAEVERFARKNQCDTLSLEVRISNVDAQRLYRTMGFESRKILTAYYNENKEDAVDMVKVLE